MRAWIFNVRLMFYSTAILLQAGSTVFLPLFCVAEVSARSKSSFSSLLLRWFAHFRYPRLYRASFKQLTLATSRIVVYAFPCNLSLTPSCTLMRFSHFWKPSAHFRGISDWGWEFLEISLLLAQFAVAKFKGLYLFSWISFIDFSHRSLGARSSNHTVK